jgi:futalosine hydrolase
MQLLVTAATSQEILYDYRSLSTDKCKTSCLITGVGLMAATYSITKYLHTNPIDLVLQIGIAGSLDKDLQLNEVVCIKSDSVADLGVEENNEFKSLFDLKLIGENDFPWDGGVLTNNNSILEKCGLKIVNGITINEISTNQKRINWYKKKYNARIESMEGAGLHYVCLQEKVPFLQIRSISNYVGERDKSKWSMKQAIEILNNTLLKIIKNMEP